MDEKEYYQGEITKETLRAWNEELQKWKAGKANLDERVVTAEEYWKLRHWKQKQKNDGPAPASGWLVNCILSKHSDAVDAYPEPVFLPREAQDKQEAENLSAIVPVILEQQEFGQTWADVWWAKLKGGTGVYGVYWDKSLHNGLGDVSVKRVDVLNLFWEPGVADIQDSKAVYHVALVSNERLEQMYPQLEGQLQPGNDNVIKRYRYNDTVDTGDKSAVIDRYYKQNGVLHYCKYVGETVLDSTEGNEQYPDGLYEHGKYPFVFDALFPEEGYPGCGYGYVDLCRDAQDVIDTLDKALVRGALASAYPRWFIRSDGGINEKDYAQLDKPFVRVQGRVDQDSLQQIVVHPPSDTAVAIQDRKINEMKQVSGNRDVNNGGTTSGVTTASGIAALQEAGNSLSRDMIATSYRKFAKVCELVVELIRQFYTVPRKFRITGKYGAEAFVRYDNKALAPNGQGEYFGQDLGIRLPVFDIEVEIQAESQYTKAVYNDLAVNLYKLGAFNPAQAEQALMMLDMMDFKGKNELAQKIQRNAMLQKQLAMYQQLALALSAKYEPGMAQGLAAQMGGAAEPRAAQPSSAAVESTAREALPAEGEDQDQEHGVVRKARQQARDGAKPR